MFAPNPNPPPLLRNFFTASETVEEDLFGEVFLLSVVLTRKKDSLADCLLSHDFRVTRLGHEILGLGKPHIAKNTLETK